MTFLELSKGADVAKLPEDHVFYGYEQLVLSFLKEGRQHPEEHTAMVTHWGMKADERDRYEGTLTVLNGTKNRVWHILLHYKYWQERNLNPEMVSDLLSEHNIDLKSIPLPDLD